jgi:ABC-type transporter Mla subunit MlaD
VSDSLEQLAARADETMRRIDAVLSDRNQEAIAATLENLSALSGHADETMQRLDRTLSSVGRAADGLAAFEGRVAGDADALTSRYDALGVQATASLRDITESVHRMSKRPLRGRRPARRSRLRTATRTCASPRDRSR